MSSISLLRKHVIFNGQKVCFPIFKTPIIHYIMPTVKAENIKQLLNNELDSVRNLKPTPKKVKTKLKVPMAYSS